MSAARQASRHSGAGQYQVSRGEEARGICVRNSVQLEDPKALFLIPVLLVCKSTRGKLRHGGGVLQSERRYVPRGRWRAVGSAGEGQGGVVDEKELVRCLVGRKVRDAALDVFEDEPNVPQEF